MSYFDIKQNYYTDILTLIDKTIASGGNIEDVRVSVVKLIKDIDELKSQI